jgi:hypothetical protein
MSRTVKNGQTAKMMRSGYYCHLCAGPAAVGAVGGGQQLSCGQVLWLIGDSVAVMGRVGGNTSRPNLVKSRQQMSKRRREESSG